MKPGDRIELVVGDDESPCRLDAFLARHCAQFSRVQLRRAINADGVAVNGRVRTKAAFRLAPGDSIAFTLPELPREAPVPEPVDLDLRFEDEHLAVVNKPPAMVVHPAKGHWSGTLANALAHHFLQLSGVGGPTRPGIVHRLDRDTSGLVVVAKHDAAHLALSAQWQDRSIKKEYLAIVAGEPDRDRDMIDQPIGIHPYQREKMAIRSGHTTSRDARTFFEVQERFAGWATVLVRPHTGRTHQIRVHLAHIGTPVLCDRLYGGRAQITRGEILRTDDSTIVLARQALHARRLEFLHPVTREPLIVEAPLPADLQNTVATLRERQKSKTN